MRVVIDGDVIVYRVAWSCEDRKTGDVDPWYVCAGRINTAIEQILERLQTTDYVVYLTGGRNYRLDIYPEYKSSRSEKPKYYRDVRNHLIHKWGAVVTEGVEADDAMAIEGTFDADTVIASIDKDMLQVPCSHYNFVTGKLFKQDEFNGWKCFYTQILTGDSTDDIPGLSGIGPVKAGKILLHATTKQELHEAAANKYREHYGEEWHRYWLLNGQLLYLLRDTDGNLWDGTVEYGSYNSENKEGKGPELSGPDCTEDSGCLPNAN